MNEKITEMKPALLQMIRSQQFASMDHKNPHTHLYTFYELCGTIGMIGIDEEVLLLRLFPFSLIGNAN